MKGLQLITAENYSGGAPQSYLWSPHNSKGVSPSGWEKFRLTFLPFEWGCRYLWANLKTAHWKYAEKALSSSVKVRNIAGSRTSKSLYIVGLEFWGDIICVLLEGLHRHTSAYCLMLTVTNPAQNRVIFHDSWTGELSVGMALGSRNVPIQPCSSVSQLYEFLITQLCQLFLLKVLNPSPSSHFNGLFNLSLLQETQLVVLETLTVMVKQYLDCL